MVVRVRLGERMKASFILAAAALALTPVAASATTVTTVGSQTSIFYDNVDSNVALGDFNLALEPVAVNALFSAANVAGTLNFGVFSDPASFRAGGSIDINILTDNEFFSGTFDGTPLDFVEVDGDFVATFSTTFASGADIRDFVLSFSGFDRGDQFQVNIAPEPIPLPASVLMLLGALGGLGIVSRRRSMTA